MPPLAEREKQVLEKAFYERYSGPAYPRVPLNYSDGFIAGALTVLGGIGIGLVAAILLGLG